MCNSGDLVEAALADALIGAKDAGRWDIVAKLAGELEARRLAREARERAARMADVVNIADRRGLK